ncbi:MAG: hypothetical protein IRZ32_06730 [Solirubrobacteraceae bacterium]|nr:hypothetical protein [Solirubrobacteraceae bacterium]
MASRRRTAAVAALAAAAALAGAGCGGDDGAATTATGPATTGAAATADAEPAPATAAPRTEPAPAGTVEQQEGGAGDEEPARVTARLRIDGATVRPARVSVPAFFTIRVVGVSADGEPHRVEFAGGAVDVPAGGRAAFEVEGLRDGTHPVTVDGREGAAEIVAGAEPGP